MARPTGVSDEIQDVIEPAAHALAWTDADQVEAGDTWTDAHQAGWRADDLGDGRRRRSVSVVRDPDREAA